MSTTDFVAVLALLIAGASLALEVKRWFESGPKISITVMGDALLMPADDKNPKLAITVYNRGDTSTTITHMIVFAMHPRWQFWRKKLMTGVVNSMIQPIPSEIGVNRTWLGMMRYDETTSAYRAKRQLYVGVICSHSRRDFLVRVPSPRQPVPTKQVGGQ